MITCCISVHGISGREQRTRTTRAKLPSALHLLGDRVRSDAVMQQLDTAIIRTSKAMWR
jgi:hypothetical protein